MAQAPKCKLCGRSAWGKCDHGLSGGGATPSGVGKRLPAVTTPTIAQIQAEKEQTFVTLATNNVTQGRGRPKCYENNAAKQKAYRERQKA